MALEEVPATFVELVPDLVVEVVSPGDTRIEVRDKVEDWLDSGALLVWVLYPATRSATVYQPNGAAYQLSELDSLNGEGVVPGFSCRVGDLFD